MSINKLEIDEFEFEFSFFYRKISFSSLTKMYSTGLDKFFGCLKEPLMETTLLSTYSICFDSEIRKLFLLHTLI